jgi:AraC-like DNA-binding protein
MDRIISSDRSLALRDFVRAYAQRHISDTLVDAQPVVASLEQVIYFDFANPVWVEYRDGRTEPASRISIVGAHSWSRASLRFQGHVESFAIFLQPFALWQLFRIPNRELNDRSYDCADVLGPQAHSLWQQMAEATTFQRRVEIAEAFLLKRIATAVAPNPIMAAAMHMFKQGGIDKVAAVADGSGLSIRQFQRNFQTAVGLHPKLFSKIARFQRALDAKLRLPHRPWIDIAHEFGYHDQMHMLLDFRSLAGETPNILLPQLGDGRPAALSASE